MHVIWIAGFGLLGIFSRYAIDTWWKAYSEQAFLGTLFINLVGSMLASLLYIAAQEKSLVTFPVYQGLLIGFCGGFTTFSSFALQAVTLLERGKWFMAFLYLFGSPALGLLVALLALRLSRAFL